jgi:hypothetical protein
MDRATIETYMKQFVNDGVTSQSRAVFKQKIDAYLTSQEETAEVKKAILDDLYSYPTFINLPND